MTLKKQLETLAAVKGTPCVSISLNTHRTFPENAQDDIVLKNLLKEAENRVLAEFGKRPSSDLLEKISKVATRIDHNYNLDSLHIFLSDTTQEIIKSSWPVRENTVHISESFALRPIIKEYSRKEEYLILLLSLGGAKVYKALNNSITSEVENEDFPFLELKHPLTIPKMQSDAELIDNIVRDHLNQIDKAIVKLHNVTDLPCIVIATEDNYSRLLQVADKPHIYCGYDAIDYNNTAEHQISQQGWAIISSLQQKERTEAIQEMKEAIAQWTVLTDLQEIYAAAIDGRGELLIVHENFSQSVMMIDERTFDLINDNTLPRAIDDITSTIVWEVLSKKGRVYFTAQEEIKDLGKIVLKSRF